MIMFSSGVYAEEDEGIDSDSDSGRTVSAAVISNGVKDIDVSVYKGDAAFAIPIASIPGRNGLGYDLALTYNSDIYNDSLTTNNISQASEVGLGFNLGVGFIYRDFGSEKTTGKDYIVDQSDDRFYVNFPVVGSGELVKSGEKIVSSQKIFSYRSKDDSFARFEAYVTPYGNYITKWVAIDVKGTVYEFDHRRETIAYNMDNIGGGSLTLRMRMTGCTQESDCLETIEEPVLTDADKFSYQWDLTKIKDLNGNEINFEYNDDVHTIEVTNAGEVSVDYSCFDPYSSKTDGYTNLAYAAECIQNVYKAELGCTDIGLAVDACKLKYKFTDGQGCTALGGTCLPNSKICDNSTVIGDVFLGQTAGTCPGDDGIFLCQDNYRCWRSVDEDFPNLAASQSVLCHSYTPPEVSCEDYSGDSQIGVDYNDVCRSSDGGLGGYYVGNLAYSTVNSLTDYTAFSDSTPRAKLSNEDKQRDTMFATSKALSISLPSENPITNSFFIGENQCCAGFGDLKQGEWYTGSVGEFTCTPKGLTGEADLSSAQAALKDYYRLPDSISPNVGCYAKYHGDVANVETCIGFDVGPADCSDQMDFQSANMLYSCCVGEVVSSSPAMNGQCLPVVPVAGSSSEQRKTCAVRTSYVKSCPQTYVATSYLTRVSDSAGNSIVLNYNTGIRDDYKLQEAIKIEPDFCGDGVKTVLFEESEHVTRNKKLSLASVKTYTSGDTLPMSEVKFNYGYFALTGAGGTDNNYKKLILKDVNFYGTNSEKIPTLKFSYGTQVSTGVLNDLKVNKVTYPTGGSVTFGYEEINYNGFGDPTSDYEFVQTGENNALYMCDNPLLDFDCPAVVGYRVNSKTADDGMGESYTTVYSYGNGVYHVDEANKYVGYGDVTVQLPDGYGEVQTWFANDNTGQIMNDLLAKCQVILPGYSFSSGGAYPDLYFRMSDVAYKTESRKTDGTVVSKSENTVCPVVVYNGLGGVEYDTKTYISWLRRQENTVDSVKTTTDYKYDNEVSPISGNGLVEKTINTNSDGKQLVQLTKWCHEDTTCYGSYFSYLNNSNLLSLPFETIVDDALTPSFPYLRDSKQFYNDFDGTSLVKFLPYQNKVWLNSAFVIVGEVTSYDQYGNPLEVKDGKGHITKYYYGNSGECGNSGNLLGHSLVTCEEKSLDGASLKTKLYYDNLNRLIRVEDWNNVATEYSYDDFGRMINSKFVGDSFYSQEVEYNYGLDGCTSLVEGDDNCMNWVRTTDMIDNVAGLKSESKSYVDGAGMHMRSKIVKEGTSAIQVDTTYNAIAKVDEVREPTAVVGVSTVSEILNNIVGESDSDIALSYGEPIITDEKAVAEDSVKYFYKKDPLARTDKVFPLAVYNYGDEDYICGGTTGIICTQTEYNTKEFTGCGVSYSCNNVTDAEGKSVASKIDKFGNVVAVKNSNGDTATNTYDVLGQVIESVDFKGRSANPSGNDFEYDSLGRVTKSYNLNHNGPTSYYYDINGNVDYFIDPKGRKINNIYDELDRVVEVCIDKDSDLGSCDISDDESLVKNYYDFYSNGVSSCRFDNSGNAISSYGLLCAVDELGNDETGYNGVRYEYDKKGNLIRRVSQISDISYEYDDAGNVVKIIGPDENYIEYTYNKLNQLETVSINGNEEKFDFNYTDLGLIDVIQYPGTQPDQDFSYNARNWVETINVPGVFGEVYAGYDNVGNLGQIVDSISGTGARFTYDNLYRLSNVNNIDEYYNEGTSFTIGSIDYTYDKVGNRMSRNVDVDSGIIDDATYTYGTDDRLDSTDDGCTYSYNQIGALTGKTCVAELTTYEYDNYDRLKSVEEVVDGIIHGLKFKYDIEGKRVYKFSYERPNLPGTRSTSSIATYYVYGIGINPLQVVECQPGLDADFNFDKIVNLGDTGIFASVFYSVPWSSNPYFEQADLDNDGSMSASDVGIFASQFAQVCGQDSATAAANKVEICNEMCSDPILYAQELSLGLCVCD